jgi:hypothetical protein
MTPVTRAYVLPRCSVAIYETVDDGDTLGTLVWTAQSVDNLRISEAYDEVQEFATGIPYPETHHLAERHELTFDAVWNVAAKMVRNQQYILAITWQDAALGASTNHWVRRFYVGVTTSRRELGSREGNEFGSSNTLRAKYYVEEEHDGEIPEGGSEPGGTKPGDPVC